MSRTKSEKSVPKKPVRIVEFSSTGNESIPEDLPKEIREERVRREKSLEDLSLKNMMLMEEISKYLQKLGKLEVAGWKKLKLSPFTQHNAIKELAELYRDLLEDQGGESGILHDLFASFLAGVKEVAKDVVGKRVKAAEQIKHKIDELCLRSDAKISASIKEQEKYPVDNVLQVNRALEEQFAVLQALSIEVEPLFEQIGSIDNDLAGFDESECKTDPYSAKKRQFECFYQDLLQQKAELDEQLQSQLNGKNGSVIEQLMKSLNRKLHWANAANWEINNVKTPGLDNYCQLLNSSFDLQESGISSLIEKIKAEIPRQKHENELREECAGKMAILAITYQGLTSPRVQFKVEEQQANAIEILTGIANDFNFAQDQENEPVEEIKKRYLSSLEGISAEKVGSRLKRANEVISSLDFCLDQAKLSKKNARHNPGYFLNIDDSCSVNVGESSWQREDLVAYCRVIAEVGNIALEDSVLPHFIPNFEAYQQTMAFNYRKQLETDEPKQFLRQLGNIFQLNCGDTDTLDIALKEFYQTIPKMAENFQKQFPIVDKVTLSTFIAKAQFSRNLDNLDEQMQTLIAKQEAGELESFIAEQFEIYADLQQRVAFPNSQQVEAYNLDELAQLRQSRDLIAKSYKLHWLSAVQPELERAIKLNPNSEQTKKLQNLQKNLANSPLSRFLDHAHMAGVAHYLQEIRDESAYYNLCLFHNFQEVILKNPGAELKVDRSNTRTQFRVELVMEAISANQADAQSKPLQLEIPEGLDTLYKQNQSFLQGIAGFPLASNLGFAEDKELIAELAKSSWREQLEKEIRDSLATKPETDEICSNLLVNLRQAFEKIDKLPAFYNKLKCLETQRREFIDELLKEFPHHENAIGFFCPEKISPWQQIQSVLRNLPGSEMNDDLKGLQGRGVTAVLGQYQRDREALVAAKSEGFKAEVNYQDLLARLERDKKLLDAGLVFHQKLEEKRRAQVGATLDKMAEAITILGGTSGRLQSYIAGDYTPEQKQLLEGAKDALDRQLTNAKSTLKVLQLISPYDAQALKDKVDGAESFLVGLGPMFITEVVNEEFCNKLNVAGKGLLAQLFDMFKDAYNALCSLTGGAPAPGSDPKLGNSIEKVFGGLASQIKNLSGTEDGAEDVSAPQTRLG